MRADPDLRRPAPPRKRADFLPTARRAWGLLVIFARRSPALLATGAVAFAASNLVPSILLERAHIGLGTGDEGADFGRLGVVGFDALVLARFALPAVIGAGFLLAMQRVFLAGGRTGFAALREYASWARVALALVALKAVGAFSSWVAGALPALLVASLGAVSATLSLILLAPLFVMLGVSVVRLSLAPPALALGLPKAAAESWEITRGRVLHMLGVWMVASAPLVGAASALSWWGMDGYLTCELPLGLAAVLLAGAVSSLLYKSYRLPPHLRPDRRPSRNRSRRSEPALAK
jgi:hypothetical protein